MARGIYISPSQFVSFAEAKKPQAPLVDEIATRARSGDLFGLGFMLPNPDPILKKQGKDISVYRDLRTDAHVGGCIRRRKAAVKGLELRVSSEKASEKATGIINDLFSSLDMDRMLNEILDAVLFGWQPLELTWAWNGGALVPAKVEGKPGEWFMFDPESQLRFRSRNQPLRGEELPPRKFLLAQQEASYANPYGFADLSMCFWPSVFKRGGLKFWVTFTEKYGTPWLVAKTPRGTPQAQNDELLDKLESMVQDAVAVIPDDASVDTLEASDRGASTAMYKDLLMFCRSEVAIALLGQNQSTEASSTHASATAGLAVAAEIRDGDARLVEATLKQLVRWIVDVNEGTEAPAPTVDLFEKEEVNGAQADRDESLVKSGVRFTPKYWKRTYKLEDDDIEETPAPVAASEPGKEPKAGAGVGTKYDAGLINAYSMGLDRLSKLGVKVPEKFVRDAFSIPTPKGGEKVLESEAIAADPSFAEAQSTFDATKALSGAGAPVVAGWIAHLKKLVDTTEDLGELQDVLVAQFGELPANVLSEVMGLCFELAHLQGRDSAEQERANV